jgi:hypothetical protein
MHGSYQTHFVAMTLHRSQKRQFAAEDFRDREEEARTTVIVFTHFASFIHD